MGECGNQIGRLGRGKRERGREGGNEGIRGILDSQMGEGGRKEGKRKEGRE